MWRPTTNWSSHGDVFTAARALVTTQGMAHVQRAGLQRDAQHGIFHSPGTEARAGYRVALTGRITFPNAAERVAPHEQKGHYSSVLGPDGAWSLPGSGEE